MPIGCLENGVFKYNLNKCCLRVFSSTFFHHRVRWVCRFSSILKHFCEWCVEISDTFEIIIVVLVIFCTIPGVTFTTFQFFFCVNASNMILVLAVIMNFFSLSLSPVLLHSFYLFLVWQHFHHVIPYILGFYVYRMFSIGATAVTPILLLLPFFSICS